MVNKLKNLNLLAFLIIFAFLIIQVNSLNIGGTTIDERSLDNGNQITYEKLKLISEFEIFYNKSINPSLTTISSTETYGQFISFQQFIFSRILYDTELIDNFFSKNSMPPSFYSKISYLRNLYLNIYVSFLLILSFLLISKFKTQKFAILFLTLLVLIPSFSGHSLFNQKDIMFMFHIFFASFLIVFNINSDSKKAIFAMSIASGLVVSLRITAAGFLALCILFCIFYEFFLESNNRKLIIRKYINYLIFTLLFYFIFSPAGWFNPVGFLQESINQQILLEWNGSTLTDGEFILSSDMDRYYLLKWYFYKLPFVFHVFLLLGFSSLYFKKLKNDRFYVFSLFFLLSVNLIFIFTKPAVYDGVRQFLFLIPFIVYISAAILDQLKTRSIYVFPVVLVYLIYTQSGLGPYKYVYFNEFVDEENITYDCQNIDGCGNWLTDYWGYSARSLAEYINKNNYSNVYICKTAGIWDPYINESLKPIYTDTSQLVDKDFLVATIYRPRFQDDGCGFNRSNIKYDCRIEFKTTTMLRQHEIDLNYLKTCKIGS